MSSFKRLILGPITGLFSDGGKGGRETHFLKVEKSLQAKHNV